MYAVGTPLIIAGEVKTACVAYCIVTAFPESAVAGESCPPRRSVAATRILVKRMTWIPARNVVVSSTYLQRRVCVARGQRVTPW